MSFTFYLGVHVPSWLTCTNVPLFVSHRRLRDRKKLPRAVGRWGLDSGGFSALTIEGKFTETPREYAAAARRYNGEIGGLDIASIQDWMCEPVMLKRTGLSIEEHQHRSVQSYEDLLSADPSLPWMPVLQGQAPEDYCRHANMYAARGHDLRKVRRVGVGSVCRRQSTVEVHQLLDTLQAWGASVHAFGFKTLGLPSVLGSLASSDSMAWSFAARRAAPMPGHTHANCANCLDYALAWRKRLLVKLGALTPDDDDA